MQGINPEQFEQSLAYLSHKLVHTFRQRLGQICRKLGYELTPEELGILMVLEREGGATQTRLSEVIDKDKASITRLLNRLSELNFVQRMSDEFDRRISRAYLTDEGRKAYLAFRPELQTLSSYVFSEISEEDFQITRKVLEAATAKLRALSG